MAIPTPVRVASALALTALLAACGDKNPIGPDEAEFRAPTPQFNAVELLITIIGDGGDETVTGTAPSFSLSSLPDNVDAGTTWSRAIPIDPRSGFEPDMAVDYGDGSGPKPVDVTQSGGAIILDPVTGNVSTTPTTYSFTLSHKYLAAGTYTVTVLATNYGDAPGTRVETATIIVAADPRLYIDNFQMTPTAVQGQPHHFSFDTRGPAGDPYSVTLKYGSSLTQHAFVPANGTYSSFYQWPTPGTYEFSATISNGDRSATVTRQVVVEPAPITITAFAGPENASFGEEATFSFKVSGPGPHTVTVTYGDGSEPSTFSLNSGATVTRTHTWAQSGLWDVVIEVTNGFTTAALTEQVTILRPKPTIDDFSAPATLHFSEQSAISFVPNDASEVQAMGYEIFISENGSEPQRAFYEAERGVPVSLPIQAPDYNGVYEIKVVLHSGLNRLVLASDTVFHTLTVEDLVCTAGTYRDGSACVDAPAGSYVPADGAFEAILCAVGTYQDQAGATSCIPAQPGSYVDQVGATQATLCAPGTYQPSAGSSSCLPASPGSYAGTTGATQATLCAPGTYQASSGATSCDPAAPGSFVSGSGASQATPCAPGTYQPSAGSNSCVAASPGSYVALAGATQATLCAPGEYQPSSGASSCDPAAPGSFVSDPGASYATPCAPGTYQPSAGSNSCLPASPGSYAAMAGATQATFCAPGTYQSSSGATSCDSAAPGSFVSGSGASQATLCPLGTYQPANGQTSCVPAPVGSYVDVTGATAATQCPVATSTAGTGSTSPADCIGLAQLAQSSIEQAVDAGTLVPASSGRGGEEQFNGWLSDLDRSFEFLDGPQRQAGCVGVRNALAKADGLPSPKDVISGPARAGIEAALRRILDEYGCN